MKTLTKTVLSLGLAAFACSSFASSDKWEGGEIESKVSPSLTLNLFKNGAGQLNVGISYPSTQCVTFTKEVMDASSFKINGVAVKMYAQCVANGRRMDFPATARGKEYVMSELKTKNSVTYEQDEVVLTFSAIGFNKAIESVLASTEGI